MPPMCQYLAVGEPQRNRTVSRGLGKGGEQQRQQQAQILGLYLNATPRSSLQDLKPCVTSVLSRSPLSAYSTGFTTSQKQLTILIEVLKATMVLVASTIPKPPQSLGRSTCFVTALL